MKLPGKKFLSMFLSASMALTFLPVPETQAFSGHRCTNCSLGSSYSFSNQDFLNGHSLGYGKSYYLAEDIQLTESLIIDAKTQQTKLCLNGYTLTGSGSHPVITVQSGTFYLYDYSGNGNYQGKITGGGNVRQGGGVLLQQNTSMVMDGGTISGNYATNGGGVYVGSGASFQMKDGATIQENTATLGGGIATISGNISVDGTSYIRNNTATDQGGGIYLDASTLSLKGSVTGNSAQQEGGGIFINALATATLDGATITNNTANLEGGGIYHSTLNSTINLAGNIKIYSNSGSKNAVTDNLSIQKAGNYQSKVYVTGPLGSSANISLHIRENGSFLPGLAVTGSGNGFLNSTKFTSDSSLYLCELQQDGNLYLVTEKTPLDYFTVTFNSTGGSAISPYTQVLENTTIASPKNPSRTDYEFIGWYTTPSLTTPWNFSSDIVTGDMTLYAKWEEIPQEEEEEEEEEEEDITPPSTTPPNPVIPPVTPPEEEEEELEPETEENTEEESDPSDDDSGTESEPDTEEGVPEEEKEEPQEDLEPKPEENLEQEEPETEEPPVEEEEEDPVIPYVPTPEQPFEDVSPEDWYYGSVGNVTDQGYMSGTSSTTFSPDTNTTRGMIAVILYNIDGSPLSGTTTQFPDVSSQDYFAHAVTWAVANEVFAGYSDGYFRPHEKITREHLSLVIYQYAQTQKSSQLVYPADLSVYSDYKNINGYAFQGVQWAVSKGILSGRTTTTLNPQGDATRAEVAVMVDQFAITNPVI